jgi:putative SOS response-associated peptidase YedK
MCGRLVLTGNYRAKIKAIFADLDAAEWLPPRYNITPAQRIPAVLDRAPTRSEWVNWGFPPTQPKRPPLINARSETAHELPTFRDAFAARRCIIFADGFYEWKRDPALPAPQPYFFQLADQSAFAVAGLWQAGDLPNSVILTTEANALMHPIHDRMPVIFSPQTARLWLSEQTSAETLRAILQPYPSDQMRCHPVSLRVNRASSEGASLIEPTIIYEQDNLF